MLMIVSGDSSLKYDTTDNDEYFTCYTGSKLGNIRCHSFLVSDLTRLGTKNEIFDIQSRISNHLAIEVAIMRVNVYLL